MVEGVSTFDTGDDLVLQQPVQSTMHCTQRAGALWGLLTTSWCSWLFDSPEGVELTITRRLAEGPGSVTTQQYWLLVQYHCANETARSSTSSAFADIHLTIWAPCNRLMEVIYQQGENSALQRGHADWSLFAYNQAFSPCEHSGGVSYMGSFGLKKPRLSTCDPAEQRARLRHDPIAA